jgi:hypothetical protein
MSNAVAQLSVVPGRSDAERAAEHRRAIEEALKPVLSVLDIARTDGFVISFTLGIDYAGRANIASLSLAKHF